MTLFVHGAFDRGRFLLWGEVPPERAIVTRERRGRRAAPPPYPFDPGGDALAAALAAAGLETPDLAIETAILRLPTHGKRPRASSSLVEEPRRTRHEPAIAPWTSAALRLPAGTAVELLCRCTAARTLAPGVFVTADLAFWAQALRFAGALVARKRALPDVDEDDGGFRARWRALPSGSDIRVQARLAAAMPHACRAASLDGAGPEAPRSSVLRGFLHWAVDALIRGDGDVVSGSRAADDDTVDGRWLAALHAPDGRLDGDPKELSRLARRAREWRRPLSTAYESPFRLCFRLEEPVVDEETALEGGEGAWTIRYLLQSNDDPSLLVEAAEAWRAKGRAAQG